MWFSKKTTVPQNEYETIFNNAPIGIYTLNKTGVVESINKKMLELSGIQKAQELIGVNVLQLSSYKNFGLDKFILQGLSGISFETQIKHVSFYGKKTSWRKYRGVPIFNEKKNVLKLLLLVEDITDTKIATDNLKEEHTRLQSSLNSINMGFIITGNNGEVVMANFAAKQMFCAPTPSTTKFLPNPKLVNLKCSIDDIAISLKDSLDIKTEIKRCMAGSKPFEFKDIQYKNMFLRIRVTPIILIEEDQKLNFIGVAILAEDTTEAKILDRARQDFFSIAAHELKTPLAVIKGNAEIINKTLGKNNTEKLKQMLNDINQSSIKLIEIVDDFLDLSRFEQGKLQFKDEILSLSKIISDVVLGLTEIAKQKNLYLKIETKTPLKIKGDEARIKQILINILGNAIKYTEKGGITISYQKQDNLAKILIKDTGVGISMQNQRLVFRKFQLAEEEPLTRSTSRSTGVGLYISKLLVEGMGGQIQLEESIVGKGSIFSFTIPLIV